MRGKKVVVTLLGGALFAGALIGLVLSGVGPLAWSQDKQGKTKAAADGGGFTKVYGQWKALVEECRDLQLEYRLSKENEREGLRAKYTEKFEQARALLPQVGAAAEAAFKADPKNTELQTFLLLSAETAELLYDDYEQALRLCQVVFEHGTVTDEQRGPTYTAAAEAAMQLIPPRFDLAEKYLAEAAKAPGKEPPPLKKTRDKLAKEKEHWAAEEALRVAEEKAGADPQKALPRVLLKTTKGDIVVELFENEAPNTVANFISLVEKGYYTGTAFHRVVPQFVIHGGAAKDDGTGGPGYQIADECFEMKDGKPIGRRHFRGSLTMENNGRDTGGSQFFICLSSSDDRVRALDAKFTEDKKPDAGHTVFGRVVSGFDVLGKLQRRDPRRPQDQDVRLDRIVEASVVRKRAHEYKPKKVGDVAETTAGKGTDSKTDEKTKTGEKSKTEEKTKTEAKGKTATKGKS